MILTDKIETPVAYIYFEDDILRVTFKTDSIVELEHINEIIEIRKEIQQGKKFLTLADTGNLWRVDRDARQKAAGPEMIDQSTAIAIVAKTLANRILGNFFINIDKPNAPSKLFLSEEEAIAWLKKFSD